jgi:hypothetical protein
MNDAQKSRIACFRISLWLETICKNLNLPFNLDESISNEEIAIKQVRALELIIRDVVNENLGGKENVLTKLHKNQQYEKMVPFFTGPLVSAKSKSELVAFLAATPFGYNMKRSGIREIESKQHWSLTYSRTIMGTQETFKIDCVLVRDTCRVVLDEKSKTAIFK